MVSLSDAGKHAGLVAALDRTAVDPAAWNTVCDRLADIAGGLGTVVIPVKVSARATGMPVSASIEALVQDYVASGWAQNDARERGVASLFASGVYSDLDFTTEHEIRLDPFYQEFLRRHDVQWFTGLGLRVNNDIWCAAVQGARTADPFQKDAGQRLLQVRELVELAARRSASLGFDRAEDWQHAFESAGRAVIAIDQTGRVRRVSPGAERLLDGVAQVKNGTIRTADAHVERRLSALIGAAIKFNPWLRVAMPGPVTIPHPRRGTIVADAFPMPRDYQTLLANVAVLLVLREIAPPPIARELTTRFGLTKRETEVLLAIAAGHDIRMIAESLAISERTVRAHLHAVFVKTGARKQAELVSIIAGMGWL